MRKLLALVALACSIACAAFPTVNTGNLLFCPSTGSDFSQAVTSATGQYSHVAIYAGNNTVVEAVPGAGVRARSLDSFLADNPDAVVMQIADTAVAEAAAARALAMVGLPYDDFFAPGNSQYYCSELVQDCYLDEKGLPIFESVPMNFLADDGSMPEFWQRHFSSLGTDVPQGRLGTNPNYIAASPLVIPTDSVLRRMAANMLMVGFKGNTVDENSDAARYVRDLHVGCIVLFDVDLTGDATIGSRNITSVPQIQRLTSQLREWSDQPLLITLDQEGGRVARLKTEYGFSPTVQAEYLGTLDNEDSTRHYAGMIAADLRRAGVNLNLAPVVDVLSLANPVIASAHRSFSQDPENVARQAARFVDEHHKQGASCVLKHFPGHGSSTGDTHFGLVDVTNTWNESELIPFKRLIGEDIADAIMTAHIYNRNIDPDLPATLSHKTLTGLLREQLGFEGAIITDDIYMEGIVGEFGVEDALVKAINAGADIICAGNNGRNGFEAERPFILVDMIVGAVKDGRIPVARLADANAHRMRLFREN